MNAPGSVHRPTGVPPQEVAVHSSVPVPVELLEAFWEYERALLGNDVQTLDRLFAPGPYTVRGDGTTLLVGHDAIAAFRSARAAVPTRRAVRLEVQVISDDAALIMAATADPATGACGLQTQLWRRAGNRWQVGAAHVSLPPKPPKPPKPPILPAPAPRPARVQAGTGSATPFDTSVWRVVGDPLLGSCGSGALDGLTVAVKDVIAVAGHAVGAGNPTWLAGQRPRVRSATAVDTLLDAGAHVLGIARTDEFAYSLAGQNAHYGTPPNPAVPGALSGGSTSGPATAVALGQADIGLGTDTAGSIRVPASYQGLIGFRPTHGSVPVTGVHPLAPSFDTVGWLARDARTAMRVADALMAGVDDPALPARSIVLPALDRWVSPDLTRAASQVRRRLVAEGLIGACDPVDLGPAVLEHWLTAFRTVQAHEAWREHGGWIDAHPGALGPDVAARFAVAAAVTEHDAQAARDVVSAAGTHLRGLLGEAVLVLPTAAGGAPPLDAGDDVIEDERAATVRLTHLACLAGAPAVSVPLLHTADGRPAGLCFVGGPGTDRALLRLADAAIASSTRP